MLEMSSNRENGMKKNGAAAGQRKRAQALKEKGLSGVSFTGNVS